METTYTIKRINESKATVTTEFDGRSTMLFATYDASRKNMSGGMGVWTGDFPGVSADEIASLAMSIKIGDTIKLDRGARSATVDIDAGTDPIKAKKWDDLHNEGGDGYNPYR